jgi:drug/metabolite transporter (DMT)-like permease
MRANGTMLVLLATLGLALKGVWARLAYAEGLSVETVLFYRSALSAPLVVALTFLATRRISSIRAGNDSASHHPSTTKPRIGDWLAAVGLGLFFSLGMACDFSAILDLGAGVSRVILFGYPLW